MATASVNRSDTAPQTWDRVIYPKRGWLDLDLGELWEYRDLLLTMFRRELVVIYQQTLLGPLWYLLQPMFLAAMYLLIFSRLARISTDDVPPPLFYLAGIVVWNYFADCFLRTSGTLINNAHIFGKVYFPRLIMPLAATLAGLVKFLLQMTIFLLVYAGWAIAAGGVHPSTALWMLPALLLLMGTLGLGAGLVFSSLTTKYRDLRLVIDFGIQLLLFATPVIYPFKLAQGGVRAVLWWNPLAHVVEAFRYGFFGTGELSVAGLAYAASFSVILLLAGITIFNRIEQSFIDSV